MIQPIIDKYIQYINCADKKDRFCLYIDFPFCRSNCIYCIYHSLNYNQYKKRIDEYAENVLTQIKDCAAIFEQRKPDTIYFGGGTPSLWPKYYLKEIKQLIPGYEETIIRKSEMHPFDLDKNSIDFYCDEMQLTDVSLGVQSFDNNSCKNQHRIWCSSNQVSDICRQFQKRNIYVNVDLVALFGGDDDFYWRIYEKDLEEVCFLVKPDIITTIPNYRTKLDYYEQVSTMRGILRNYCVKSEYVPLREDLLEQNDIKIKAYGKNDHWIALPRGKAHMNNDIRYSCSGITPKGVPRNQITLAFGGYDEHKCYSYLPDGSFWFYSFYDSKEECFRYQHGSFK